jgi:hypothetical protein
LTFAFLVCLDNDISELVKKQSPCHLFLDEVPADRLTPKFWEEIQNSFPKEKYLWVAFRADLPPYEEAVNGNFIRTDNNIIIIKPQHYMIIYKHTFL